MRIYIYISDALCRAKIYMCIVTHKIFPSYMVPFAPCYVIKSYLLKRSKGSEVVNR